MYTMYTMYTRYTYYIVQILLNAYGFQAATNHGQLNCNISATIF